ncbi:hypothetical protein MTO96_034112, partial [Rhipicephalus appendiculatus]
MRPLLPEAETSLHLQKSLTLPSRTSSLGDMKRPVPIPPSFQIKERLILTNDLPIPREPPPDDIASDFGDVNEAMTTSMAEVIVSRGLATQHKNISYDTAADPCWRDLVQQDSYVQQDSHSNLEATRASQIVEGLFTDDYEDLSSETAQVDLSIPHEDAPSQALQVSEPQPPATKAPSRTQSPGSQSEHLDASSFTQD